MKRYVSIIVCTLSMASTTFAQPATEKAEKRLADLLAPQSNFPATTFASQPITWKGPRAMETIVLPIPAFSGLPVRLPIAVLKEIKPRSPREGTPLAGFQDKTAGPVVVELPTQPLIRLPAAVDVNTPTPIPILARPASDRAPLGEPGFEASLGATLKRFSPTRDQPVPFMPLNLPDPFEFLRYGQLRNPPEENPMPPVIPLRRPTK